MMALNVRIWPTTFSLSDLFFRFFLLVEVSCWFLAVDEQGSVSKASLSCSTLEKLRGFSCHGGSESRAACESEKMEGSGTGQLQSTMREQVKMEEDTEEGLVQSKQVW